MFKGAIKEDLRLIASELELEINEKMTVYDLNQLIKTSEKYKQDQNSVNELANSIIESRKEEENKQMELERIKLERSKNELELARIRAESKPSVVSEEKTETLCSIDSIIKSIKILTLSVPSNPESWGIFFSSLERAFNTKSVPEKMKAEILLNLLGEKAANILMYIKDEDIDNYQKIKELVLREFQPTPQICLDQFKRAHRLINESHVQFATRLANNFEYYLKLRKVSEFDTLKQLIVSDKLFETLDKETASHISIRQADSWFKPLELGKEVDLYFTSRGKSLSENCNNFHKNRNNPKIVKNASKVFLTDIKNSKCILCDENHTLCKCPNYLKLPVNERVEVVKNNKLCFNCLNTHSVSNCKSRYSCFCKKRHHRTLHFPKSNFHQTESKSVEKSTGISNQLMSNGKDAVKLGQSNSSLTQRDNSFTNALTAPEFVPGSSLNCTSSKANEPKAFY